MRHHFPPSRTSSGTLLLVVGNTLCAAAQAVLRTEKRGSWGPVASLLPEKDSLLKNVLDSEREDRRTGLEEQSVIAGQLSLLSLRTLHICSCAVMLPYISCRNFTL